MENKVIAFTGIKELEIRDHSIPELGENDVLVHVKATALCTQEQRFYTGGKEVKNYPAVGGHESSGEVVEVGKKVRNCKVGDKVACIGGVLPAMGRKRFEGEQSKTPDADGYYKILQGTLAKYVVRNEEDVVVCNQAERYEDIALAEPVACVLSSINKADIKIGDTVVVMGCGIMGLLHVQLAKMKGAYVIATEIDPERTGKALEMGADVVLNPKEVDAAEEVKKLTEKEGAQVVINTTPLPANYQQAFDLVARRGKIICYSSQHPDEPIPVSMGMIHSTQIQLIGTLASTPQENFVAAKLLAKGMIKTEGLLDQTFAFEDAKAAFERAIVPGTYRVIIAD